MNTPYSLVNGELVLSSWYSASGLCPSIGSYDNIYDSIKTIAMTETAWYFLDENCNIHMRLSHKHWRKYEHDGRFHFMSLKARETAVKEVCDAISSFDTKDIQTVLNHIKDRLEVIDAELDR